MIIKLPEPTQQEETKISINTNQINLDVPKPKVVLCGDVIQVGSPYDDIIKVGSSVDDVIQVGSPDDDVEEPKKYNDEKGLTRQGLSYCHVGRTFDSTPPTKHPTMAESDIDQPTKYNTPYVTLPGMQGEHHAKVMKRLSGSFYCPSPNS